MYRTHENQQKEINTIQGRTLELDLSDADVKRIAKKAGEAGLTIGELLMNFVGDLVDGTYSNGSDERMYAQRWFERCGFSMNCSFLSYAIQLDVIDDILAIHQNIADDKAEMEIVDSAEDLAELQVDSDYWQGQLKDYWVDYTSHYAHGADANGTPEDAVQTLLEWQQSYNQFLESSKTTPNRYEIGTQNMTKDWRAVETPEKPTVQEKLDGAKQTAAERTGLLAKDAPKIRRNGPER